MTCMQYESPSINHHLLGEWVCFLLHNLMYSKNYENTFTFTHSGQKLMQLDNKQKKNKQNIF